ncbi:MAG: SAM-dependent chlorinase/fluorinase [Armatimonadota bacterium]|nr:SAM-dependent chlorinase/fluorinase [Armatimonadota bacterium]
MRIVTLLTDFGQASPYPAEMRAVLCAGCRARVMDITHEIPAHDIASGAYVLAAAAPAFPAGTVHVAVVDPGVGTARLPLVVASGGHLFVGPDNGLLMPAARALGHPRAHVIDEERFGRPPRSATFHGRDLFAPAAAALASGLPVEQMGAPVAALVDLPEVQPARAPGVLTGQVVYRDAFGNLVTNIPGDWLRTCPESCVLDHPRGRVRVRRVRTYGEGDANEPLVLVGSNGTIEIAIRAGRAAEALGVEAGAPIALRAGDG